MLVLASAAWADGFSNSNSPQPFGNISLGFDGGISQKTNTPSKTKLPGDILANATAWYGLRAYSASYAAPGTHPAINVLRFADNHTCDILITSSGNLGNTSNCSTGGDSGQTALSWAGIDATCMGTLSGTTLSCTGASATPTGTSDMISGAGIFGLYVSSCGAFVGGAGTCTLNAPPAANITTPELITFVKLLFVEKWYDQSGNGHDITISATPAFNPIGLNGTLPIVIMGGGHFNTATIPSTNITYMTGVAGRQVGFTNTSAIIGQNDVTGNGLGAILDWQNVANTIEVYGGSHLTATAADSVLHSFQGLVNGASSVISVDGTETTGAAGNGNAYTVLFVTNSGSSGCCINFLGGSLTEVGAWPATPSSGIRKQMCQSMSNYWGTSGTC